MDDLNCNSMQFLRRLRQIAMAAMAIASWLCAGCQTWQKSHETAVAHFSAGNLEASRSSLAESQKTLRSEKELLELDLAVLDLASGDVRQAEGRFRELRLKLDHLTQTDITERASSIMTDSRAVAYAGRDFERRMVLNMALLSSILGDGQDSFAYSLQVTEAATARREAIAAASGKSSATGENTGIATAEVDSNAVKTASYSAGMAASQIPASSLDEPLALSSYLAASVQSETPSRSQETEQALADIGYWNPAFRRREEALSTGEMGTRSAQGNGTLHVISLIGRAPRWVPESAEPTSTALLIADRIISATGKHTLPPTISSVKIARPEPSASSLPIGSLKCEVRLAEASSGVPVLPLTFSTIVDLDDVAMTSYREHRDEEIGAAIARRVVKKGAVYVLKETQNIHRNSLIDLGVNIAGVAWEALEKPDTRSWRMLPSRIDVARMELPAGEWVTTMNIAGGSHASRTPGIPVQIEDGRNTYVLCIIPEREFSGHILVGGADVARIAVNQE